MSTKIINKSSGGAFYCLGGIGAFVYFMQNANGVGEVVIGILKSFVWPAFFVHRMFEYLGM